jgi:hypothetical protein
MAAKRKRGARSGRSATARYGAAASDDVASAVRRMKRGTLRSGPKGRGGRVTSRKQAIAIGLDEARREGAEVPPRPRGSAPGARSARGAKKKRGAKRGTARAKTRATTRAGTQSATRRSTRKTTGTRGRKTAGRARKKRARTSTR